MNETPEKDPQAPEETVGAPAGGVDEARDAEIAAQDEGAEGPQSTPASGGDDNAVNTQ